MMDKRFSLEGKTADGSPLIHLVEPGSSYGLNDSFGLTKTASGEHLPEVIELIESIQRQPGRLYLVNSALGAGEFVGYNLRGDWFTEKGLLRVPKGWDDIPVWDIDRRRRVAAITEYVPKWGNLAWGYPTFYNAHKFRHHVNKDPNRAYGFILGAFWDPRMHRVILVSELIQEFCERLGASDLYSRIECGEFPDTSMGARVPYDRCSICNHYAKTPNDYCEHVHRSARPPYGMKVLLPDGRRCGVFNDYPCFFDDSYVFIGAEKSAKNMANVTNKVRGSRAYSSKIYSIGAVDKIATADNETELAQALATASTSPVAGPASRKVEEQLSQVLSLVPMITEQDKKSVNYIADKKRREAAVRDGNITRPELELWSAREMHELRNSGVDPASIDKAKALIRHHMDRIFGEKNASYAKWAEHIKEIPAPGSLKRALMRDHVGRLVGILPKPVLDEVARNPAQSLSDLAHCGVVLKPAEFLFCMRKVMGESGVAEVQLMKKVTLRPVPLNKEDPPKFSLSPPSTNSERLRELLSGVLARRSFAPRYVAARIADPPPLTKEASAVEATDSQAEMISHLYNNYRAGLLSGSLALDESCPELPVDTAIKIASTSKELSTTLVTLAYWPAVDLV